jgi:hypothetical protein
VVGLPSLRARRRVDGVRRLRREVRGRGGGGRRAQLHDWLPRVPEAAPAGGVVGAGGREGARVEPIIYYCGAAGVLETYVCLCLCV